MTTQQLYNKYKLTMQKIADIKYASAVLQWDQETYLPPKGSEIRGKQIATLNELAHQQFTDDKIGNLLNDLLCKDDLSIKEYKNVWLSFEDYKKATKFPSLFVRNLTETTNKSFHAWIKARKENSFKSFEAPLNDLIKLKKQEAEIIGYQHHPYNALMNDYDKGITVSIVDKIFDDLKPQLSTILANIKEKPAIDNSILHQPFNKDKQWQLGVEILKRMQFDFEAGRQDISEHPFTTNFNNADVRITTRIDENDLGNMLWSCIHEGGHALYEQGLPSNEYGLPLGEYCSLSIHESQSRLWENNVGRGVAFWKHNFSLIQQSFTPKFNNYTAQEFYVAINKVTPSLIRTEADEITYHFHIMIRYEIEKLLIDGSISTKEIPSIWNELYFKYLGIKVPNDKLGCLQDVHWSHGSFGYFATYSLGSLYAAQFFNTILLNNPQINKEIEVGHYTNLNSWLKNNIYSQGRFYTSEALCEKATGENLNSKHFIEYITKKYQYIYYL